MNKKTLIIVIAILAVILVAGIAAIFVLSAPETPDAPIGSEPANMEQTGEPVQKTDAVGETVAPDVTEEEPAEPTQKPVAEDPTVPTQSSKDPTDPAKDPTKPTQSTKPTDPAKPTDPTKPTDPAKPTKPQSTEPKPTEPTELGPLISGMEEVEVPDSSKVTYLDYYSMSADEQASFINSFESLEAFFAWHTKAKEEYESDRVEIDGSTPIDLEEILGGN